MYGAIFFLTLTVFSKSIFLTGHEPYTLILCESHLYIVWVTRSIGLGQFRTCEQRAKAVFTQAILSADLSADLESAEKSAEISMCEHPVVGRHRTCTVRIRCRPTSVVLHVTNSNFANERAGCFHSNWKWRHHRLLELIFLVFVFFLLFFSCSAPRVHCFEKSADEVLCVWTLRILEDNGQSLTDLVVVQPSSKSPSRPSLLLVKRFPLLSTIHSVLNTFPFLHLVHRHLPNSVTLPK